MTYLIIYLLIGIILAGGVYYNDIQYGAMNEEAWKIFLVIMFLYPLVFIVGIIGLIQANKDG